MYIYSLRDGINDGFLTPFKVKQISTTLDEYIYTPDDRLMEGEIESGRRYTESDFNRIIEIRSTVTMTMPSSALRLILINMAGSPHQLGLGSGL